MKREVWRQHQGEPIPPRGTLLDNDPPPIIWEALGRSFFRQSREAVAQPYFSGSVRDDRAAHGELLSARASISPLGYRFPLKVADPVPWQPDQNAEEVIQVAAEAAADRTRWDRDRICRTVSLAPGASITLPDADTFLGAMYLSGARMRSAGDTPPARCASHECRENPTRSPIRRRPRPPTIPCRLPRATSVAAQVRRVG
jgi:hypothetical protein